MPEYYIKRKEQCPRCKMNSKTDSRCPICHGRFEYTRDIPLKILPSDVGQSENKIYPREAEPVTKTDRPSDQELICNAVRNAKPGKGELQKTRWACVRDVLMTDSATAMVLCRETGVNPDDFLDGGFCHDCPYDPENSEG